jgi:NAD(P)-dependent dehydrogenase (short-subunit alcohol dehydrogenase family)
MSGRRSTAPAGRPARPGRSLRRSDREGRRLLRRQHRRHARRRSGDRGHALAEFGPVDSVVGNAGTVHASPFEALGEEAFATQVDVHVMGAFHVTDRRGR